MNDITKIMIKTQEKNIQPIYSLDIHESAIVDIIQPYIGTDFIVSLSSDRFVILWNISLGNPLNEVCCDACPTKLTVFRKLGFLFIPKWDNTFSLIDLSIFNLPTKNIIDVDFSENEIIFSGHKSWVTKAIEMTNQEKFMTSSRDFTIRIWNIYDTKCEYVITEHTKIVNDIIEFEEGLFGSCSSDMTIKIWDSEDFSSSRVTMRDGSYPVFQIEKLLKHYLASRNESPQLKIWNFCNGQLVRLLNEHTTNIICMKVLKNGKILTGSYDHTAKIWNVNKEKSEQTLKGHNFTVFSLAEYNNGKILTGSGDNTIKLWDVKTNRCTHTFIGHTDYVISLLITKNNEFISGSYDNSLKIWKIRD